MNKNNSQKIIEKVRDDYDLIAREWDLSRNRASKLKIDLISEIKAGDNVLDVGCGNALMLPFILEKYANYFGIDISEKIIEIAEKKYKKEVEEGRGSFFIGQATELPFKNDEFDFVISFATLHHIPSKELQEIFFKEIKRVCKPNAKVKITVWNLLSDWANKRFDVERQLNVEKSGEIVIPWKATQGKIINRYYYQFSKKEVLFLAATAEFKNIEIDFFTRKGERKENGEEMVLNIEV